MVASNQIVPADSKNNVGMDYISPVVDDGDIVIQTRGTGGSEYASFDATNSAIKVDEIREFTGSNGIDITHATTFAAAVTFDVTTAFTGSPTFSANLVYSGNRKILCDTSDASDTGNIIISGGGDSSSTRGAQINILGNEHATNPGELSLESGAVSGGDITISASSTNDVLFKTNSTTRLTINGSGEFVYNADSKLLCNTSDASDSGGFIINGGGDSSTTRGAQLSLRGNEDANTGQAIIESGAVSGGDVIISASSTNDIILKTNSNTVCTLDSGGVFTIPNATSVPGAGASGSIRLYAEDVSASAELKVMDEASNVTVLSPHRFSLMEPSHEMAWSFHSQRGNKEINVDMFRVVKLLEELTGEKLIYIKEHDD